MHATIHLCVDRVQVSLDRCIDRVASTIVLASPSTPLHAFLFDPLVSSHEGEGEVVYTRIFPSREEAEETFVEVGASLCLLCAAVFRLSSLSVCRTSSHEGEEMESQMDVAQEDDIDALLAQLVATRTTPLETLSIKMVCQGA